MTLDDWYERCAFAAVGVIAKVLEHLPDEGTLIDIGANVGVVTAAAIAERDATVYAFEPVPTYADYCQRRNPDARIYPVALGYECERKTLWLDETNLGWNTFETGKTGEGMTPVDVKVMPLDMYPEIAPDVVKVDVEGYEWAVLRGAHEMLRRHRPVLVVELGWGTDHPRRAEVVTEMEWLFDNGYERIAYDFDGTTDVTLVPT